MKTDRIPFSERPLGTMYYPGGKPTNPALGVPVKKSYIVLFLIMMIVALTMIVRTKDKIDSSPERFLDYGSGAVVFVQEPKTGEAVWPGDPRFKGLLARSLHYSYTSEYLATQARK